MLKGEWGSEYSDNCRGRYGDSIKTTTIKDPLSLTHRSVGSWSLVISLMQRCTVPKFFQQGFSHAYGGR